MIDEASGAFDDDKSALVWRCFHCDQVFDTEGAAAAHFGRRITDVPECTPYLGWLRAEREKTDRIRAALERVLADIAEYERVNNLAPNPGRKYCWDSVAQAHAVLSSGHGTEPSRSPSNEREP